MPHNDCAREKLPAGLLLAALARELETLQRVTELPEGAAEFVSALKGAVMNPPMYGPRDCKGFVADPLVRWSSRP